MADPLAQQHPGLKPAGCVFDDPGVDIGGVFAQKKDYRRAAEEEHALFLAPAE